MKFREKLPPSEDKVQTITSAEPSDDLKWVFKKVSESDFPRAINYLPEKSITNSGLCYSVTYLNETPVLASCAWNRDCYEGMIRVATRYCVNPDFKHKNFGRGTDGFRIEVSEHIDQQVEFTKSLGFENHFFSREDRRLSSNRMSVLLAKDISRYSSYDWKCTETRRLVCPDPAARECWQYVIYNNSEWLKHEDSSV